ncbi:hypothetical protein JCM8202v2_004898 [Rhodotorula sphaerocarpa]
MKRGLDPLVVKAYKQTFKGQKDLNIVKAHKSDNTRIKDEVSFVGEKIDCGCLAALANKWLHSDIALKTHALQQDTPQ